MKTQDRFLNSNNSKLDEDKDDEVIITLEVPRVDQTIVITSDSESDDSDITVLPTEKFKPKPNGQLVTDSMNEPVVNLESDDDLFVYDDKSLFDATSDVVKGNDPFLSANIGVNEDDCKVRLFDIDFSYQSSTKKSESVESTPVGIAQGILDIHAPLAKPVFLTSNALPENDSSAPVDVLFSDPFSKASHASYSITHMTPSENETAAFKNSVSSHENSAITTKKKLLRNYLSKNSSKDLTVRKSSNTHSDSSWSVVSTEKNKVVLRRSPRTKLHKRAENSKKRSANSPQICKKKSRQTENQISNKFSAVNNQDTKTWSINKLSDIGSSQSLPAFVNSNPQEEQSMCYGCKLNFGVSQLSYCMAGHGCCGQCIQIQVKSLLAKGRKGVLKCRYIACNSFYLVSQLRNSLPPMVVEILEEKLDREYCDNAAKLMMQASGHCSNNCPSKDCITAKDGHGCQTNLMSDDEEDDEHQKQDPNFYQNLPRTWEPMPKSEEYRLVELCKSSEEYNWVAAMFHQTMTRPRATIVKIKLLQNPILWQFYNVKKTQMERDSTRPVIEKNLFHGTGKKAVEAICRTNFDWRLCGSHGTSYGQGSYFARDAAYSHMYTDQPAPSSLHRHLQAPLQNAILFNTSQSSQISQQPHHIPSHPHHVNQSSAGQLAHQIIFQTFPGTSHSVSIAALQSCRFARIPLGPSGAPQQVVIPPTGVPPTAISFHHYWSLNGGSSASGSQLPQLSRPNGSVLHPSSANKQLHPAGQHHHHSHHLPASHLGHHGHHIPHQPINLTISQQDHIHVMFLARVLVGDYTLGKNSYRKPPSRDPSDPYGKCYDACVNDITNPTIYVIFNSSQCYPEYIIEYTNKPREM